MKKYVILVMIIFSLTSCKKEKSNSQSGNFKLVISNGPTLNATYTDAPLPSASNTFSFQSTNRALISAYFDVQNYADLDIWPFDKIGKNIVINKIYKSTGDWMASEDDFEFGCDIDGVRLDFDYSEIVFTKYNVPGEIVATFKALKNNAIVATGEFNFISK
jgi:hypothetical protein